MTSWKQGGFSNHREMTCILDSAVLANPLQLVVLAVNVMGRWSEHEGHQHGNVQALARDPPASRISPVQPPHPALAPLCNLRDFFHRFSSLL